MVTEKVRQLRARLERAGTGEQAEQALRDSIEDGTLSVLGIPDTRTVRQAIGRLAAGERLPYRRAAIRLLCDLAEQGWRLRAFLPALTEALEDRDEQVRHAASFALAFDAVSAKRRVPWQVLDQLLAHEDRHIRWAACQALTTVLLERGQGGRKLVTRIALALADSHRLPRKDAAYALAEAASAGIDVRPERDAIPKLARALSRKAARGAVFDYLKRLAAGDRTMARAIAAAVQTHVQRKRGVVAELLEICKAAADERHQRPCRICSHIPRSVVESSARSLPKAVMRLEPEDRVGKETDCILRCPECGSYYSQSYSYEVEVCSMFEEFSISRLSPTRALEKLEGDELARLKADYPERIRAEERKLSHVLPEMRAEAGWALAQHYLAEKDLEGLDRALLQHADPNVICEALGVLVQDAGPGKILAPLVERLNDLLEGQDERARGLAGRLACRYALDQEGPGPARRLLGRLEGPASVGALGELRAALRAGEKPKQLGALVRAFLPSPHEALQIAAVLVIKELMAKGIERQQTVEGLVELLAHEQGPARRAAADCLACAAEHGAEISSAVGPLAALLEDEHARYAACSSLLHAARLETDISAAVPALARAVVQGSGGFRKEAVSALHFALQAGQDISAALGALAAVLGKDYSTWEAVEVLALAAEEGLDLSPALDDLEAFVGSQGRAHDRERAMPVLLAGLVRHGRWESLADLAAHPKRKVRRRCCELLLPLLEGLGGKEAEALVRTCEQVLGR